MAQRRALALSAIVRVVVHPPAIRTHLRPRHRTLSALANFAPIERSWPQTIRTRHVLSGAGSRSITTSAAASTTSTPVADATSLADLNSPALTALSELPSSPLVSILPTDWSLVTTLSHSFLSFSHSLAPYLPPFLQSHPGATSIVLLAIASRVVLTYPARVWSANRGRRDQWEVLPRLEEWKKAKAKEVLKMRAGAPRGKWKIEPELVKKLTEEFKEKRNQYTKQYKCSFGLTFLLVVVPVPLIIFLSAIIRQSLSLSSRAIYTPDASLKSQLKTLSASRPPAPLVPIESLAIGGSTLSVSEPLIPPPTSSRWSLVPPEIAFGQESTLWADTLTSCQRWPAYGIVTALAIFATAELGMMGRVRDWESRKALARKIWVLLASRGNVSVVAGRGRGSERLGQVRAAHTLVGNTTAQKAKVARSPPPPPPTASRTTLTPSPSSLPTSASSSTSTTSSPLPSTPPASPTLLSGSPFADLPSNYPQLLRPPSDPDPVLGDDIPRPLAISGFMARSISLVYLLFLSGQPSGLILYWGATAVTGAVQAWSVQRREARVLRAMEDRWGFSTKGDAERLRREAEQVGRRT